MNSFRWQSSISYRRIIHCRRNLRLLRGVLLVHQNITIPRLARFKVDNDLVGLLQRSLLHPWLDLLVRGKLKHLFDLMWSADSAAANLDSTSNQSESVHGW